jgi:hypothetical protein
MDRSLFGDQRFLLGSWSEVTMIWCSADRLCDRIPMNAKCLFSAVHLVQIRIYEWNECV